MGANCCIENDCLRQSVSSLPLNKESKNINNKNNNAILNKEKNEEKKSNQSSIAIDGIIYPNNNNDFLVLIIGNKNNNDVKKVLDHIDDHFYGKTIENLGNNTQKYIENDTNYILTVSLFENIKNYSKNNYKWIISFSENIEEIIEIINIFKKKNYMFKKFIDKNEILNKCKNIDIQSNNLLLTNHFRIQINNYFSWNNVEGLSISTISDSIDTNIDTLELYKCPLSKRIMEDPVITIYGHHYERKNIEEEIRNSGKSPRTNQPLQISDLIPDEDMKNEIKKIKTNKLKKYN